MFAPEIKLRTRYTKSWWLIWTHMILTVLSLYMAMDSVMDMRCGLAFMLTFSAAVLYSLAIERRAVVRTRVPTFEITSCPTIHLSEIKARRFHIVEPDGLKERASDAASEDCKFFEEIDGQN